MINSKTNKLNLSLKKLKEIQLVTLNYFKKIRNLTIFKYKNYLNFKKIFNQKKVFTH